jgi:multidrug efflux pump subunit AcrA (membrane-fusion protein)
MDAFVTLRESKLTYKAKLTLIAGAADETTRLVPITGELEKTEAKRLRPGAACKVSIPVDAPHEAIIVPSLAIAQTDQGNVVYIVDPKTNQVHVQPVETGMHTSTGGIELSRNVTAGQIMVVHGIEPLVEDSPVKIGATLTEEEALVPPDAGVARVPVTPGGAGSGSAGPEGRQ